MFNFGSVIYPSHSRTFKHSSGHLIYNSVIKLNIHDCIGINTKLIGNKYTNGIHGVI